MFEFPLSVFLDTNIFYACKYNIGEKGSLRILQKFIEKGLVEFYTSNIVLRESEKHIKEATEKAYKTFKTAQKNVCKFISSSMLKDSSLEGYLELPMNDRDADIAIRKFHDFLEQSNTIILDNDGVELDQVIDDYFNCKPPFENNEKKKSEFPDAIMISKLIKQFTGNGPICVVSKDKGFQNALTGLEDFFIVKSLKELFDMLNKQVESQIYSNMKFYLGREDVKKEISKLLEFQIRDDGIEINGLDCDRKGFCEGYDYEETYIENISSIDITLDTIDEITEKSVLVTVKCSINIDALCYYDDYENSVWDSEEKEYLFLKQVEMRESHNAEFASEILFSFSGINDSMIFELSNLSYELELDESTRNDRKRTSPDDFNEDAMADMMEAFGVYHNAGQHGKED